MLTGKKFVSLVLVGVDNLPAMDARGTTDAYAIVRVSGVEVRVGAARVRFWVAAPRVRTTLGRASPAVTLATTV
jgi:hypothetical protein